MDGMMLVGIYSKAQNHWIYFCLIFTRSFLSISSIIKGKKILSIQQQKPKAEAAPHVCSSPGKVCLCLLRNC